MSEVAVRAARSHTYVYGTRHTPEMIADLSRRAYEYRTQVLRMVYERKTGHLGRRFPLPKF